MRAAVRTAVLGRRRLSFDFTTGSLPSAITYTGSNGSLINASGTLVAATTNVARFTYSPTSVGTILGLLIEPAATNVALRSGALNTNDVPWDTSATTPAAVVGSAITSPDGTADGWKITQSVAINLNQSFTLTNGVAYCFSAYLKKSGTVSAEDLYIFRVGTGLLAQGSFNFDTGIASNTVGSGATMTDAGGGWYRCAVHATTASTSNSIGFYNATEAYGTLAQLELGTAPTSYVPTVGTAVTRTADAASFTIPAGITSLLYTFDDNSTQAVSVSAGAYTIPTNLNRPIIKSIVGS